MWKENEHPRDDEGKFAKKDYADMSVEELKEQQQKEWRQNTPYEGLTSSQGLFTSILDWINKNKLMAQTKTTDIFRRFFAYSLFNSSNRFSKRSFSLAFFASNFS